MPESRPVKLTFTAEVAQALQAMGKLEISAEDLEQAFVEASNSSDDLERKIRKATRDAEKDVEKLERAIKDDLPKATDHAADEATRDFHRVGDEARDAGQEAGSEFRQNLGESLASGGSLQDIMADTLGGLIASMPGAAGVAAGVVGGAALLVFNEVKQHAEEMKAAVESTFSTMWDNVVGNAGDAFGRIQAEINVPALVSKEFTRLWEEEPEGMKKLVDQAKELGIAAGDIVMARAGDAAAIDRVKTALDKTVAGTGQNIEGARKWNENIGGVADAIDQGEQALAKTVATTQAYNQSVGDLPPVWGSVQDAIDKTATSTDGVVDAAKEAKIKAADINMDGLLDDVEIAKAGLAEIDAIKFAPKTVPVKVNLQFTEAQWNLIQPGIHNSSDIYAYKQKYGVGG